jgi:hypothetical protein
MKAHLIIGLFVGFCASACIIASSVYVRKSKRDAKLLYEEYYTGSSKVECDSIRDKILNTFDRAHISLIDLNLDSTDNEFCQKSIYILMRLAHNNNSLAETRLRGNQLQFTAHVFDQRLFEVRMFFELQNGELVLTDVNDFQSFLQQQLAEPCK